MKPLLVIITIGLLGIGGYPLWQTTLLNIPVESYLSETTSLKYYIDTAKFSFNYFPAAKRFEISRPDGQKVDIDLTSYDDLGLQTLFANWIVTSSSDRQVSYVPNLETCKYLAISLRYTEIAQMKLGEFIRCYADLANKDNLVPI